MRPINIPSIEVQKEIVKALNILNHFLNTLQNQYKKKLESFEELKKSILQKAFTGELTKELVESND